MRAARKTINTQTAEDLQDFLCMRGLSKAEARWIVETELADERRSHDGVFHLLREHRLRQNKAAALHTTDN